MSTESAVKVMATIVKFRSRKASRKKRNVKPRGVVPDLLARTCMKIGVVDVNWVPPKDFVLPNPEEWWIVHIVHETHPGRNKGCLILRPISKVENGSMNILLPGFFDQYCPNPGTMIVTPKNDPHGMWYLPLKLKNTMMAQMGLSLIVANLGGAYWGKDKDTERNKDGQSKGEPETQSEVSDGDDDTDTGGSPRDVVRKRILQEGV